MVSRELGLLNPPGFLGLHVLQLFSFPSGDPAEFEKFTPEDYAALEHLEWFQSVGGYNAINATRPQTVAVGISDSPVGQLAWNELFNSFGNGTSLVTPDQILTEVSLYWFTNTSAAAGRYHYEEAHAGTEPAVNARTDRRRGLRRRLQDDPPARRARQHQHRPLERTSRTAATTPRSNAPTTLTADLRTFFRNQRSQ